MEETRAIAAWAFDQILVMLHPFMPFITEELWHAMGDRETDLIIAQWPHLVTAGDTNAQAEIDWVIKAISEIRANRTMLNVPPGSRMEAWILPVSESRNQMVKRNWPVISKLARINWSDLPADQLGQDNTIQAIADDVVFALQLEGVIDIAAEKTRLAKALAAAEKERDSLGGRLSNPSFVEKAKPEAVVKAREDHADKSAEADRLKAALDRLG